MCLQEAAELRGRQYLIQGELLAGVPIREDHVKTSRFARDREPSQRYGEDQKKKNQHCIYGRSEIRVFTSQNFPKYEIISGICKK
jgi:hypothetical protein